MHAKKERIYPAFVSKNDSNYEKQVILLMILNAEKREPKSEGRLWHYLAVKNLSALLRGTTLKNNGDFYCMNCFDSFRIKTSLNQIKQYVKTKIFVMQLCHLKTVKYKNLINIKNLIKCNLLFMHIFSV